MALFGFNRDTLLVKSLNRELVNNIIEQQVGYYKPKIDQIKVNLYGEAQEKFWIGPVLINCLIDRGAYTDKTDEFGPDVIRTFQFRFIKESLESANVIPEKGDALLFNEDYFEVTNVDQNRFFLGKDKDYSYSSDTANFGSSLHIVLDATLTRIEKLGIKKDRL